MVVISLRFSDISFHSCNVGSLVLIIRFADISKHKTSQQGSLFAVFDERRIQQPRDWRSNNFESSLSFIPDWHT